MQHILIMRGLGRRTDRRQRKGENNIPAQPMVLVYPLARIDASKDSFRDVELCESNQCLAEDEDVGNEAHDAVNVFEACLRVGGFAQLNNDETGDEEDDTDEDQGEVNVGSLALLDGGVRGLEEENGLGNEEDAC